MEEELRVQLSLALGGVDAHAADLITRERTQITEVAAGLFQGHRLYRILYRGPHHPIVLYVGAALPDRAVITTGRPEAFLQMAQDEHLTITSPALAVRFFVTFLEATRSQERLLYLVTSVGDVRFMPRLYDEETSRASVFSAEYAGVITPPAAVLDGDRYLVTCFACLERRLVRIDAVVSPSAQVQVGFHTLEEDLPLVHSR